MCVVNGKHEYEVILETKENIEICSIGFKSITLVCRFLDELNFDVVNAKVFKFSQDGFTTLLDPAVILKIWRNE